MASQLRFGGVRDTEISEISSEWGGPPAEAGASAATRFVIRITDLVAKRMDRAEEAEYAIFVLSQAVMDDVQRVSCEEVPLLEGGGDAITGAIWITTATLGTAFRVQREWSGQAELFGAVRELQLGSRPAVVIDWRERQPKAFIYYHGIDEPDARERVIFEDAPLSAQEMKSILDRFYARSLRTPHQTTEGHAQKVWQVAVKGHPLKWPEKQIQGKLVDALKSCLAKHLVRAEQHVESGRVDVLVWIPVKSEAGHLSSRIDWLLELKAICDRTSEGSPISAGANKRALEEGLGQADSYRKDLPAIAAALCCYDMRKDDVGDQAYFAEVVERARELEVSLWRWFLYRSAKAARLASHRSIPTEA